MLVVRAEVSFNTPYAAYQHERTDLDHPRGGEAKYLERALLQHADEFSAFVAARVKAAMKGAGLVRSAAAIAKIQRDAAEDAVGAFAEIIAGEAQRNAPILEGILRASAEVSTGKLGVVG